MFDSLYKSIYCDCQIPLRHINIYMQIDFHHVLIIALLVFSVPLVVIGVIELLGCVKMFDREKLKKTPL